ncbi:MAG TPA: dihydrolipoyl dehydrogenase [Actinomycetota bacterium]
MPETYDVVVLGAGTGGYAAALRATSLDLNVAMIERDAIGGTCLNIGCIPTKALLHSADVYDTMRDASTFGVTASNVGYDWGAVQARKTAVVERMVKGLTATLKARKVETIKGTGTITAAGTVTVDGSPLKTKNIVIATGSKPKMIPGLEAGDRIITSDEALLMDHVPQSAVILGAGAIGVEFASLWASFGCAVTLVEMLPSLVPLEDPDAGKELARAFRKRGIASMVGAKLEEAKAGADGVTCRVSVDGKTETIEADVLLVAVGRGPVTDGAGLESIGVATDRGFVVVDEYCRTNVEHVYAVGDVIPTLQLAHVSFAEGMLAAEHIAGREVRPLDYDAMPRATYCDPEISSVGLTEPQARERGFDVETKSVGFGHIGKAAILNKTAGFCKIVAEKAGGRILGVHMVGPHVTDLLAEAMLAYGWEATAADIAPFIHPHPTLSEVFGETALALVGRPLHT